MITGFDIQDTIKPKLVIRINTDKLLPDSVFRKLDEAPAHIRYADSIRKIRRVSQIPEVSITDTTSVCARNSIADVTLYDSLSFVRNIDQLPPVFFPYQFAEKPLPVTYIKVINNLKDGRDLPQKPLHHDWIIAIIFLAAYLWLIVRTTTRSIFPELTRFILFRGINESSVRDTGSLFTWQSTILNFISFMVIGLFAILRRGLVRFYSSRVSSIPVHAYLHGRRDFCSHVQAFYLSGSRKSQRRIRGIQ